MAAVLGRWRATYTPGDWLVLSGPTSLVLLEPPTHEWAALTNTLWEEVVASSSIVDLADRLASFKIDALPSFGAFFWTADGMRSLVRGQISIIDLATGKEVANGAGIQTWSEVGLAGVSHIRVDTPYDGDATLLELPLVVGAVRASSIVLDASEQALLDSPQAESVSAEAPGPGLPTAPLSDVVAPSPSELPQHGAPEPVVEIDGAAATEHTAELSVDEIAALQSADTQLLPSPFDGPEAEVHRDVAAPTDATAPDSASDAAEPVDAGPTSVPSPDDGIQDSAILAVLCQNRHANPPSSMSCRVCGSPLGRRVPQFVAGPILAVLRASDGSTAEVDRPVLIGRAPSPDRSSSRSPRLMTVPSANHDISRTHLEVAPAGWQIVVTDLNSTNGTVLVRHGAVDRQQLAPGEPVPVQLGSVIELGDGVSVLIDFPQ
ncbi:MAG TPA: FHA domain-containing protein [Propionibacteriaceae bacterium]|nr:FHA domain-containing protein [Propionibacteriaceae bacterium]